MASSWLVFLAICAVSFSVAVTDDCDNPISQEEEKANEVKIWALLVAGSKGFSNYRHQADVCHAYQVLRNHGVPDDRIVVMMYDDIAHHSSNPTPGVILNHPKGRNVYAGVPKDYTGNKVTPKNFLDVLQGKKGKGGSGKVIRSSSRDHVFVYFSDHGTPGMLGFPNGFLYGNKFISVIRKMSKQGKFARMAIYVEACHSGLLFDGHLPSNINVYATTAANASQYSFACYYDSKRKTYLGDLYSVSWMEHSDSADLHRETLIDQYNIVKRRTNRSQVLQFGDSEVGRRPIAKFQGLRRTTPINYAGVPLDAVPNSEVAVAILRKRITDATDNAIKNILEQQLQRVLRNRCFLYDRVTDIAMFVARGRSENIRSLLVPIKPLRNFDCYEKAVQHFNVYCFDLSENTYARQHLGVLVNMCESKYSIHEIKKAMNMACTHPRVIGIV